MSSPCVALEQRETVVSASRGSSALARTAPPPRDVRRPPTHGSQRPARSAAPPPRCRRRPRGARARSGRRATRAASARNAFSFSAMRRSGSARAPSPGGRARGESRRRAASASAFRTRGTPRGGRSPRRRAPRAARSRRSLARRRRRRAADARRAQPARPREHRVANRRRDVPALTGQHLCHVERIAPVASYRPRGDCSARRASSSTAPDRERLQRDARGDPGGRSPRSCRSGWLEPTSSSRNVRTRSDGRVVDPPAEVLERVERRLVGPVHVLEDGDRRLRAELLEEGGEEAGALRSRSSEARLERPRASARCRRPARGDAA